MNAGAWWQDVTVPMLEVVRRRPGFSPGTDHAKFPARARGFLRAHMDHVTIEKLRKNKPLTPTDLVERERMLVASGLGGPDDVQRAAEESQGLGSFVRSLLGMDRGVAKEAMASFLAGKSLSANRIEFVNLVVDHPSLDRLDELVRKLDEVRGTVVAAWLRAPRSACTARRRSPTGRDEGRLQPSNTRRSSAVRLATRLSSRSKSDSASARLRACSSRMRSSMVSRATRR